LQSLTVDLLISINRLVGEKGTVVNPGNLDYLTSTISKITDPIEAASSLLFEIITLRPFLDGNKRTAVVAAESYPKLFRIDADISYDAFEKLVYKIAIGKCTKKEVEKTIRSKAKK
jgi:prophage maintenance system killer protein